MSSKDQDYKTLPVDLSFLCARYVLDRALMIFNLVVGYPDCCEFTMQLGLDCSEVRTSAWSYHEYRMSDAMCHGRVRWSSYTPSP